MSKVPFETTKMHPKTLLLCVYTPYNTIKNIEHYNQEFLSLVDTLGVQYNETMLIKLRAIDKNKFFTKGKLKDLVTYCENNEFEQIVISEILTPLQERNLEDFIDCIIFDRERLILEIFKKSAKTAEGKIQVEMAEVNYLKTRLIGKGKEYAQQAGFIGGKGPGETLTEEIRRHFAEKIRQAKKRLITLEKSRETQRQSRKYSKIPMACLIGYTNAGKSSILNTLTKSNVLAEDKLFATLDTTIREFFIKQGKKILISDSVGFISQLPHTLIEAFKSTLDELKYASLLLHVIDLSNESWIDQVAVVEETLKELEIDDKKILYVFNKNDTICAENIENVKNTLSAYQPHIIINTKSKEGISPLINFLKNHTLAK